jgi:hypothetical protein
VERQHLEGHARLPGRRPLSANSVGFLRPASCTAVGALISGDPRKPAPLIDHWDGRAWTRTASALPASGHAALGGVSCTAARACTAVGFRQPGAAPFAEARRS